MGAFLPLLLLFASFGLAMSMTDRSNAWIALALLVGAATLASLVSVEPQANGLILSGLWASVIATAGLTYFRQDAPSPLAFLMAANAGAWSGALASTQPGKAKLLWALPMTLLFLPGRVLVKRGYPIAVRVAASWLMAVAVLMVFVSMTPTPGYVPDHME